MTKILDAKIDKFGTPLEEMARLGTEDGLDFRVYTEPLGNPSFHILMADFEIVVTIKDLKVLEITREIKRVGKFKHSFGKGYPLFGNILNTTMSFMSKKHPSLHITYKEYLIGLWNDNNPQYEISSDYVKW